MGVDDFFGFGPEREVREEDIALFAQEEAGEGEVDT